MREITVRLTRAQIGDAIREVAGVLSGRLPGADAERIQLLLAQQAQSIIRGAYIEKARGEADDAGLKWKPLAPSTIARRRGVAGTQRKIRNLTFAYRRAQEKAIWATPANQEKANRAEKKAAARLKKAVEKRETAISEVEILRDTGRLLASLSPAIGNNTENEDQVIRFLPGVTEVGTNVEYAEKHHKGEGRCPQRRLWPEPDDWPDNWRELLGKRLKDGFLTLLIEGLMRKRS